mgnify:CR=1 FL=1
MKKILIFFMFLLSLTSLSEKLIVISKDGYANLREKPTVKSTILKKIDNSYTILDLHLDEDDWHGVYVEKNSKKDRLFSQEGYIHKSQLAIHPETYITSSKDGYINVRSKPSTSSKILAELPNDAYVTRHPKKTVGDWYYVDFDADGGAPALAQGYIHKSQLKKFKK